MMAAMDVVRAVPEVFEQNASRLRKENVKRILLLYDEKVDYIGDFCMWAGRLYHFKAAFNNALVDVNFPCDGSDRIYKNLLQNNPYVNRIMALPWEDLDLDSYDVLWIASHHEHLFLDFLKTKYGHSLRADDFKLIIFSFSRVLLARQQSQFIFPDADDFADSIRRSVLSHLYLSAEEVQWGDQFLRSKGLKEHEQLFIVVDSSSRKEKLINIDVYFELLTFLLTLPDSKVLVFDNENIGKELFYEAWIDPAHFNRMIFANALELRKELAILGSSRLKLLFGPCTGLLHCASGIYNHFVHNGSSAGEVPLMITYTGIYGIEGKNAWFWWGSSPLINCVMVKETNNGKQLRLLSELPEEKRERNDSLACSEFTVEMLISFIQSKLKTKDHGNH